jgi:hypothetical protein
MLPSPFDHSGDVYEKKLIRIHKRSVKSASLQVEKNNTNREGHCMIGLSEGFNIHWSDNDGDKT